MIPIAAAFIIGGLGFPVLYEVSKSLRRQGHRRRWSLHTRITVLTYFALALLGMVFVIALEWSNPGTLGPLSALQKLLVGGFSGLTPRTAGFNNVDVGAMNSSTLLVTDVLMFIGGGSAGTAGGIKVTTFALLAFIIAAEVRGEPTVHVLDRKLAAPVQRQALTVVLLGVGAVVLGTITLLTITGMDLDDVLFEVVSAFGTVGLALRTRGRRYELPEERPIVG
ncbi:potassium transporter TrkG [Nocardia fluminea]|uniref:potassium transporter TrkG n=1 Tax=Nocardia fluminea TaxID=134984 RepID=UPI003D132056